mmetsp:Transcript_30647/g.43497  ORF Transcript_30647/g.43497 Transcript_30647/m.43497 type:complete len:233 (-) Transcript_30647:863-1561(-)
MVPPASGGSSGINKTTLKRMEAVMEELKVPLKPQIPTKRVCDLFDRVRKDILTLTVLQKIALQKEGQLQTKRLRLAKLGGIGSITTSNATAANPSTTTATTGGRVMDEEALLGIAPAPAPPPAPAPASNSRAKGKTKARSSSTGTKSKAAASKTAAAGTTPGKGGEAKAKSTTKRKKKAAEPKAATTAASTTTTSARSEGPTPVAVGSTGKHATDAGGGDEAKQPKKRARKS